MIWATALKALRPARAVLALVLAVTTLLVAGPSSFAQTPTGQPSPKPTGAGADTKTVTVHRGGRDFQTTVLVEEPAPDGRPMRAGSLLVKFRPGRPQAARDAAHQAAGGVHAEALRLPDTVRVNVPRNAAPQALAAYRAHPAVEYAEPDYIVRAVFTPNDPNFGQQWGMTKISAPSAWDHSRSSPSIRVAVLDCGIYSSSSSFISPDGQPGHPDVRAKVVLEQNFTTSPFGADDLCNHGTHVAGIAAASTNNGIGVAGVGFDASIMNGKILGDDGFGSISQETSGIVWAADNGAKVINLSVGGPGPCSSTEQAAIDYAWARGVLIVAAAGNGGADGIGDPQAESPAICARVLSVAATDVNDARPNFSNYGTGVDVAAPGVGIVSTNFIGQYQSINGTSQAAPHVAGLAALVWTTSWGTSNQAVGDRICSTADRIAGTGSLWACGRINAAAAVTPPPQLNCSPRPRVAVQVAPAGAGRLQVTLTPSTNPGQAANQIQAVRLGTLQNAAVDVPAQPGVPSAQNGLGSNAQVALSGPVASLQLFVRRVAPGAFTAPLTVTDGCGPWQTLAGGGTAVP